ncbi:syntaxin-5-like [Eurytemora carolleeae]|uniref:syntaxin-5-like n=1 Tax=Eurytemora carolleeae TaxID=1294199 RepID=UPI000C75DCB3|nr:syntaxin-5-like [Eurytemora carolleeae]|eukprot:XP_023347194.1 syntaxin-5-like [Eurytemora affinis]
MTDGRPTLRRRLGSESEKATGSESYVISSKSTFKVTEEVSPDPSPNPRFSKTNLQADMGGSSRDRTREFNDTVRSLQGRTANGHAGFRPGRPGSQASHFMKIAKAIGSDITKTYTKLEKLALLARKKTIFDDKPVEIQELTFIIKEDIANLNKQIAQLQQVAKGQRDGQGKHQQSHSTSVVVSLQSKLAAMSNNFKQVLEVRNENLKSQRNRAEQFSNGGVTSSLPQSATTGYHAGSVLAMEDDIQGGAVSIDMGGAVQSFMQDESDKYYSSRADTMHTIESTIVELGGIFSQLAHMVKEQEEMVQRIDSNVEDTLFNVELGHNEILKYFQSVTSNRWLMVKIFAVLIFFFLLFVVFMA